MPIVSVLNQKGGVGKTSTCHHLAGTFATMGKRILLLDNDPQSSLSQGFWGPQATRQLDPSRTIAALYEGLAPFPDQIVHPTGIAGVDLVPGSRRATDYNVPRPQDTDYASQHCIRAFLDECRDSYDLILIDNPPNLHLASWAALVASDSLLIVLQPEDYGAQGIADVQESYEMVISGPNPSLALLGFLITMCAPRRSIHQLYEERLRTLYGDSVFTSKVPEAVDYVEAIARRLPIAQYKPKGAPAKAIRAVAEEVLVRLAVADGSTRTEAA